MKRYRAGISFDVSAENLPEAMKQVEAIVLKINYELDNNASVDSVEEKLPFGKIQFGGKTLTKESLQNVLRKNL